MHSKKHLGFCGLSNTIARRFEQITDDRQENKVEHRLHDCLMSAFAMMVFQDPSILSFQQLLQDSIQRNNLQTIFNIGTIPKDTQFRDIIGPLPIESLNEIFQDFLSHLQRSKYIAISCLMKSIWSQSTARSILHRKKSIVRAAWKKSRVKNLASIIKSMGQPVAVHFGSWHSIRLPMSLSVFSAHNSALNSSCGKSGLHRELLNRLRPSWPIDNFHIHRDTYNLISTDFIASPTL